MLARERAVALQFGDFILELQLSPFHFGQFQLVLGRMQQFLRNFLVERIVTLSERGQMGLTRHAELLIKVHTINIDLRVCHRISNSRSCFVGQPDQIFSRLERCKHIREDFTFAVAEIDSRPVRDGAFLFDGTGLSRGQEWDGSLVSLRPRKSPVEQCDGAAVVGFASRTFCTFAQAAANWLCCETISQIHSRHLHPPIAFEIVSNGGEMNLALCLGKPEPSHGTKMIAAFPGPEDFFNSRPDRPQRAVVRFERFGRQPTMALAHKLRGSARGDDRLFDGQGIIGFVGINLARRIGDDRRSDRNIGSLAAVVSTSRMMPLPLSAAMWAL